MASRIILLSGPIASGKTKLGDTLVARYGFTYLKTRQVISMMLGTQPERRALQKAGEELDRKTKGTWVVKALTREASRLPEKAVILVDAVRTEAQVEAIREAFGPRVAHVHLTAPLGLLARR